MGYQAEALLGFFTAFSPFFLLGLAIILTGNKK